MAKQMTKKKFESYEVYDGDGRSVGRVVLPRQRRFVGSTNGTVYLRRPPTLAPKGPQAA